MRTSSPELRISLNKNNISLGLRFFAWIFNLLDKGDKMRQAYGAKVTTVHIVNRA